MHNTIKTDVVKHYLFVKSGHRSSQNKIFKNTFEEYDLLLDYIHTNSTNHVYLINRTNNLCHLGLSNYLTVHKINFTHIEEIETGFNNQLIQKTNTENLDIKTLNRRICSIDKIINREEVRLDDMVRDNRSCLIINMISNSIKSYRHQRNKLKTIIDNRKTSSGYVN